MLEWASVETAALVVWERAAYDHNSCDNFIREAVDGGREVVAKANV